MIIANVINKLKQFNDLYFLGECVCVCVCVCVGDGGGGGGWSKDHRLISLYYHASEGIPGLSL